MPIAWRSSLSAETQPALAVALSARPLATAARRAGARVIALDLFADEDTAVAARECRKLAPLTLPSLRDGPLPLPKGERGRLLAFDHEALLEAVEEHRGKASGLVYGAGFEHEPALLEMLGSRIAILGNRAAVVGAVKDPLGFAALLARLGVPHPETRLEAPAEGNWLAKRVGGSGGGHITRASAGAIAAGFYVQRQVPGRAVSALFLGDGRQARVLGHSEQWTSATAEMPFRYGGCVGPVGLGAKIEAMIDELCHELVAALGLVGLNSLDLLLDGERFHVLEVNPRPGATLDVFDGRDGLSLWEAHIAGVAGRLVPFHDGMSPPRAAGVVYAPARLRIPLSFAWPDWAADRGRAGTLIESGEPVCTVMATAATPAEAREIVDMRTRRLLERLEPLPLAPT
jgi:predicted ATP-grasp superfamily ATP-dependent carboligase